MALRNLMPSVITPHLAFPFQIKDGAVVVNEQDSTAEIQQCVEVILSTPQGWREELPLFGVPDQTFLKGTQIEAAIEAAVQEWERRANALASSTGISLAEYIHDVELLMSGPTTIYDPSWPSTTFTGNPSDTAYGEGAYGDGPYGG